MQFAPQQDEALKAVSQWLKEGRSQLFAYNLKLGPVYSNGACPGVTSLAAGREGSGVHMYKRELTLIAFSRAPLDRLVAYHEPMGGPLPEQVAAIHMEQPSRAVADETAAKKKAKEAAAKKARAARIARERRAAAKRARAAQARAKQQEASSFNSAPFGNSFGNFGNSSFGQ